MNVLKVYLCVELSNREVPEAESSKRQMFSSCRGLGGVGIRHIPEVFEVGAC
ncbi:hypothetical protein J6590_042533 [Homalodisca vitripennis]|nr:hypothetical protein J6590_042533 [Homalodisca vitripennis]